jgi:2-polyprenyl-3-methyl-5-hydroxy-6-metoxy-1,4-benzoquinol methylase
VITKPDENKITTEEVGCDLCGENRSDVILRTSDIRQRCRMEYRLVRCRGCGLVYLNPRPTASSITEYYTTFKPGASRRKPQFYERFYYDFFRAIPLKRKGSLLDVGCGGGAYLYHLKRKGWKVAGIDIQNTDYARDSLGIEAYEGTLLDAGLKSESFDAVTFWWTLEHMYEPVAMLKEAYRVLKKGGVLIAGVPNIESLEARIFGRYWFHLLMPMHLYHFSPGSIGECLKKAGFQDFKIRQDPFSFGIMGSIQCMLNDKGIYASFTNPFWYAASLPFDMLLSLTGKSGLMTAYAFKR